jgi:hypothetical protein
VTTSNGATPPSASALTSPIVSRARSSGGAFETASDESSTPYASNPAATASSTKKPHDAPTSSSRFPGARCAMRRARRAKVSDFSCAAET